MPKNFNESETKINLMRAFAGESQARNRYTFAAAVAKKEGLPLIADLFSYTAGQEKEHAEIFYNYLMSAAGENIRIDAAYPIDPSNPLSAILGAAHKNEYEEYQTVYPAFAGIAEEEGYSDIAFSFRAIAAIEKTHGDRFGIYEELLKSNQLFTRDTSAKWVCLNCGHIHDGTGAPTVCPVCHHPQGYFMGDFLPR